MTTLLALPLAAQEILLLLLVALLLFGASRIPALFCSLGRGIGDFRDGLRGGRSRGDRRTERDR